uniref:Transglutaminase C-terminal domain-containing protein n=2 Tax=Eptatretus burgeri TaxID=7764 RepID=A0A8C4R475_EPTBU
MREDITHLYKYPEGSWEERRVVERAAMYNTNPEQYAKLLEENADCLDQLSFYDNESYNDAASSHVPCKPDDVCAAGSGDRAVENIYGKSKEHELPHVQNGNHFGVAGTSSPEDFSAKLTESCNYRNNNFVSDARNCVMVKDKFPSRSELDADRYREIIPRLEDGDVVHSPNYASALEKQVLVSTKHLPSPPPRDFPALYAHTHNSSTQHGTVADRMPRLLTVSERVSTGGKDLERQVIYCPECKQPMTVSRKCSTLHCGLEAEGTVMSAETIDGVSGKAKHSDMEGISPHGSLIPNDVTCTFALKGCEGKEHANTQILAEEHQFSNTLESIQKSEVQDQGCAVNKVSKKLKSQETQPHSQLFDKLSVQSDVSGIIGASETSASKLPQFTPQHLEVNPETETMDNKLKVCHAVDIAASDGPNRYVSCIPEKMNSRVDVSSHHVHTVKAKKESRDKHIFTLGDNRAEKTSNSDSLREEAYVNIAHGERSGPKESPCTRGRQTGKCDTYALDTDAKDTCSRRLLCDDGKDYNIDAISRQRETLTMDDFAASSNCRAHSKLNMERLNTLLSFKMAGDTLQHKCSRDELLGQGGCSRVRESCRNKASNHEPSMARRHCEADDNQHPYLGHEFCNEDDVSKMKHSNSVWTSNQNKCKRKAIDTNVKVNNKVGATTKSKEIAISVYLQEGIIIGCNFNVIVRVANRSTESRTVKVFIRGHVIACSGKVLGLFKEECFTMRLNHCEEQDAMITVSPVEYMDLLIDKFAMMFTVSARVIETEQVLVKLHTFRLHAARVAVTPTGDPLHEDAESTKCLSWSRVSPVPWRMQ